MKLRTLLRNQRAAIDLASIMVGIIVIAIIGAVIAAVIFVVIPWTQDNVAKQSLSAVKTAQSSHAGLSTETGSSTPKYATSVEQLLEENLLNGNNIDKITVIAGENNTCYVATAESDSGKLFWASDKTEPVEYTPGVSTSDCVPLETVANELTPTADLCFVFTPETGTITGYNNELEECGTDVVIPGTIDGVTVKTIGEQSFLENALTSVVIPDSVTSIGLAAFAVNDLTSVVIPDSVTTIGEQSFAVNALTSVVIPDSVTSIGDSAFAVNALTNVDLGEGVTTIGFSAFDGNQLASIVIPDSVTTIGGYAFNGNALTSVVIPDSVTSIGGYAFQGNPLETVSIPSHLNPPASAFPITPTKR